MEILTEWAPESVSENPPTPVDLMLLVHTT